MKTNSKLIQLVKELGADLKPPEYNPNDRSYDVELWAPEGKQWKANGCAFIGGMYWTYIKGSKSECYQDLLNRVKEGVEDLDHEL